MSGLAFELNFIGRKERVEFVDDAVLVFEVGVFLLSAVVFVFVGEQGVDLVSRVIVVGLCFEGILYFVLQDGVVCVVHLGHVLHHFTDAFSLFDGRVVVDENLV